MSGSSPFRPRARILRTLGADLISSDRVAIVELVKNAYDADATYCVIAYESAADGRAASLSVLDDGHGMDLSELSSGWLELAGTRKVHTRRSEKKERRLLGAKGVGRLAASKLGSELLVSSRRKGAEECQLLIDWTQFDDPNTFLDEIDVEVTEGESADIATSGAAGRLFSAAGVQHDVDQGTLLAIGECPAIWLREDMSEIRKALQRLVAPATESDFRIVLLMPPEFEDLAGLVGPPEFTNEPLYRVHAHVDEHGRANLEFDGQHPGLDGRSSAVNMWVRRDRQPACGAFDLEVRVWDRDRAGLEIAAPSLGLRDFRQQLDTMAGISVYRDGFRLFPYGERGDDWLGLDRRRVNQPTMRVSNNQVIGFVHLTDEGNPNLEDQSNREGLIDNLASEDLRTLVTAVLAELEAARRAARRSNGPAQPRGGMFDEFDLDDLTADLKSSGAGADVIKAVESKAERIHDAVDVVKTTLSRFQLHATLGQLVDRVVHDGRTAVAPLRSKADLLRRALEKGEQAVISTRQVRLLEAVETQSGLLVALFDGLDPLSGRKRGRPMNVGVSETLNQAVAASDRRLCPNASVTIAGDDSTVRWAQSDIILALVNLINNALYWLNREPPKGEPTVVVTFERLSGGQVSIRVSDNGPGIAPEYEEHIFESYFSRKPDGVGLGLAIVGSIAETYGGKLGLATSELGGATLELVLGRHV